MQVTIGFLDVEAIRLDDEEVEVLAMQEQVQVPFQQALGVEGVETQLVHNDLVFSGDFVGKFPDRLIHLAVVMEVFEGYFLQEEGGVLFELLHHLPSLLLMPFIADVEGLFEHAVAVEGVEQTRLAISQVGHMRQVLGVEVEVESVLQHSDILVLGVGFIHGQVFFAQQLNQEILLGGEVVEQDAFHHVVPDFLNIDRHQLAQNDLQSILKHSASEANAFRIPAIRADGQHV